MEAKINIAEILKNKPQGTKLYSPIFGNLRYEDLVPDLGEFTVVTSDNTSAKHSFRSDGRYNRHGEPLMLLPSKEMRDWRKFAWKKGDVLVTEDDSTKVIFVCFEDDTYLTFKGKYCLQETNIDETFIVDTKKNLTECFSLPAKNIAQIYIHNIEDRIGGILNMETLEIENAHPEFKDGDIVCITGMGYLAYGIVKSIDNSSKKLEYYVLNDMSTLKIEGWLSFEDKQIQPITETQKIILFDALAKEGKAWDAEKKEFVDLKPKWTPKPFDRVITRNDADDVWTANIFSHMDSHGEYVTIACVGGYTYCLPYNEDTAKLIGTTKDVEG